jgi:general secretion pathway protein I
VRRGFTLLEVLVATVIMAVAVSGLLGSLSTSLRNASNLTEYDRAALLGRRKMDELLAVHRLPKNVPIEGQFNASLTGGLASGWRAIVTPFEMPPVPAAGRPALERVELEIWWTAGTRRRSMLLEGYRSVILTLEDVPAP